jgi:tetratricopeptide (TPR) repeat protein
MTALGCSRCRKVVYCDTECQKDDWDNHKKWCRKEFEIRARTGDLYFLRDEIENFLKSDIQYRIDKFGESHKNTIKHMSLYGEFLIATDKLDKAESILKKALALSHSNAEYDEDSLEKRMVELADLLRTRNKFEEAEHLLRKLVAFSREKFGPKDERTLLYMSQLASLLENASSQGNGRKRKEAEKLMKETLVGRIEVLGPEHIDTLQSMRSLGTLLLVIRELDEAEILLKQALRGFIKILKIDDPQIKQTNELLKKIKELKK